MSTKTTFCMVGFRGDLALQHFAVEILAQSKLQKTRINPVFYYIYLQDPLLLRAPSEHVCLPYMGRFYMARLCYSKYQFWNQDDEASNDNRVYTLKKTYDWYLSAGKYVSSKISAQNFSVVKEGTHIVSVVVNGQTIPIDYLIQSQNNSGFSAYQLDKSLRCPDAENVFFCGEAAQFVSPASCSVSGIYVAQYIKTFCLNVMQDRFTVVTTNEKKFAEYCNLLGPIYRADPKTMAFMINTNPDAMHEGFKKKQIVQMQIQGGKAKDFVHPDSDYWFIDANSLKVSSRDDQVRTQLAEEYHRFSKSYNDDMSKACEIVREMPGTDVENWVRMMDKFPQLDEENIGQHAQWRCTVALTSSLDPSSGYLTSDVVNYMEMGLITKPTGTNGFGFDSRFDPTTYQDSDGTFIPVGKTFAEMSLDEKELYSCRARAIMSTCYWLLMKDVHAQQN